MNKAELFIDCKNKLGEGITWDHDDQTLYWLRYTNAIKTIQT